MLIYKPFLIAFCYKEAKNANLPDIKYEFRVVGILTETDFKDLVRIARLFKAEKNGYNGLIKADDEKEFLALVEKVNCPQTQAHPYCALFLSVVAFGRGAGGHHYFKALSEP